jgi:hypothetical protein
MNAPDRNLHPLARGLFWLAWLNGVRFFVSVIVVSVVLLAIGDATARVFGAGMLLVSLVCLARIFRRR